MLTVIIVQMGLMFSRIIALVLMLTPMTITATNLLLIAMGMVTIALITLDDLILLIGTRRHIMITIITPAMTATSIINKQFTFLLFFKNWKI